VRDLETSRMGAPYIYDISRLRVNRHTYIFVISQKHNTALPSHNLMSLFFLWSWS